METEFLANLAILVLAGFVGFAVISKVPNTLHTPLMSGTNAIHGIVLLGGIVVLGLGGDDLDVLSKVLLVIAIAFGTINVVGGFLVTDRMLGMFKGKSAKQAAEKQSAQRQSAQRQSAQRQSAQRQSAQRQSAQRQDTAQPEGSQK